MNLNKLLARLNPKPAAPFRGTSGGKPEWTTQDIAAALARPGGTPGEKLALLVLCLRDWPAMFDGPQMRIGEMPKLHPIERGGAEARLELVPVIASSETLAKRVVLSAVARRLEAATEAAWAADPPSERVRLRIDARRPDWARAVIAEYLKPNHCATCTGWPKGGQVPVTVETDRNTIEIRWDTCPNCLGAGVTDWSSDRRALAVRIDVKVWRAHMATPHRAALSLLRDLESRGRGLMRQRLR